MTEVLFNPKYLKNLNPKELVALCASFADVKDANPDYEFKGNLEYLNGKLGDVFDLANFTDNMLKLG